MLCAWKKISEHIYSYRYGYLFSFLKLHWRKTFVCCNVIIYVFVLATFLFEDTSNQIQSFQMVFKLFQNLQLFSLFLKFLCQQYLKISISSHNTELINISTALLSQCVCIIGVLVSDFLLPSAHDIISVQCSGWTQTGWNQ